MRAWNVVGNLKSGSEVLCIGAHPDDIEIGCGGTVLRICKERPGTIIHWVVLGAQGPRYDEALDGAERFRAGCDGGQVAVQSFPDGFFPFLGTEIKDFFEELKGQVTPDLVFTHSRNDRHQDHRLVSDLTWNTWRDHTILEYEVPKWDGDLGAPNGYVTLSKEVAEAKVGGIMSTFRTQEKKDWFRPETFMGLMNLRGNECRAEEHFAEGFYIRKLRLL